MRPIPLMTGVFLVVVGLLLLSFSYVYSVALPAVLTYVGVFLIVAGIFGLVAAYILQVD
ncbi:MAG: hypothetical protein ABIC95_03780 [archaeon]